MSNVTDTFWETMWSEHGVEYLLNSGKPSFSDFIIYIEEKGLVPEMEDHER